MLKWTKRRDSEGMSRSGKFRVGGPNGTSNGNITISSSSKSTTHNNNNNHTQKDVAQNGSALTSKSHSSDDVSSSEPKGPVCLDVLLPSGEHTDISVDHNTPVLDLLVYLAGKCRLNPTGLALQLLDQDTGQPMTYKPNQAVGSLGCGQVRLVPKENKAKAGRQQEKPFEMTHRFTMNLPRGQKTVVRVSPLISLGQLMTSVCEDKSLDLRRHVLQIPGQPGVKVDLATTIQELGMYELNLVAVGLQDPRSHMVSMPDLSQPPPSSALPTPYMPSAGEHKKKRGFLSFLSKNKDKKFRPNLETSSTTSHLPRGPPPPGTRQATTPPAQRREFGEAPHRPHHPDARPKSMFVTAGAPAPLSSSGKLGSATNLSLHKHHVQQQPVDVTVGTGKKKRRAPAPPGPPAALSSSNPSHPTTNAPTETHNGEHTLSIATKQEASLQKQQQQQQSSTRAEILSRLHSRNSSDSSGYHELTLSGAESPEAPGHHDHQAEQQSGPKLKSSIDTTSTESLPDVSGANGDSGVHDLSPSRVSPIEELTEKPDKPTFNHRTAAAVSSSASAGGGKKKRKAPAPPPPLPTTPPPSQAHPPSQLPEESTVELPITATLIATNNFTTEAEIATPVSTADFGVSQGTLEQVTASPNLPEEPCPQEASTPRQEDSDSMDKLTAPTANSVVDTKHASFETHVADSLDETEKISSQINNEVEEIRINTQETKEDDEDINENTAFDINDILDGVVFDEEPKSMDLQMLRSRDEAMVMEETASIASESVDQVETARNERPCAFIPPPPPNEPPPPEVEPVEDIASLNLCSDPVLVDKGTEVNDDNTSLAPSSAKSSPVPASYKNEMALFVERMSKMAVETTSGGSGSGHHDDSVSSLSLAASDTSDTGSVIQHLRSDSRDSGSDPGVGVSALASGAPTPGQGSLPMSEEITVPVETVPPPPEFGDDGKDADKEVEKTDDEEEEYVTETVETIIIPLTSSGYDFSAAQRVGVETVTESPTHGEVQKEENKTEKGEKRERSSSTGVFRAELVSIAPAASAFSSTARPPTPPMPKQIFHSVSAPVTPRSPPLSTRSLSSKEEFVLTTEDLSNVSFLPPKSKYESKAVKLKPIYKQQPLRSSGFVSSASLAFENQSKQNVSSPRSHDTMTFDPTEPEDSPMEIKPLSVLQSLPTMRADTRAAETLTAPAFSDDSRSEDSNDASLDPLLNKLSPRLLVDSAVQPTFSRRRASPDHQQDTSTTTTAYETNTTKNARPTLVNSNPVDDAVIFNGREYNHQPHSNINSIDDGDVPGESPGSPGGDADPQDALASQYAALQSQFAQWQEQLSRNQSLLAGQTSPGLARAGRAQTELKAEQLQQLSDQVLAQQQMMLKLQETMQALQQQNQVQQTTSGGEHRSQSAAPVKAQVAAAPPPPPPPAPPVEASAPKTNIFKGMPKVKTLDSPRPPKPTGRQSRFEPVLDPREELMLAIRGFKGREGLKSVSVEQTKWVHSNR